MSKTIALIVLSVVNVALVGALIYQSRTHVRGPTEVRATHIAHLDIDLSHGGVVRVHLQRQKFPGAKMMLTTTYLVLSPLAALELSNGLRRAIPILQHASGRRSPVKVQSGATQGQADPIL